VSVAVVIPESDFTVSFVRGAGPGGQNVNKVATAAQLRFDLGRTTLLDERAKARLRALAGQRLTGAGDILIIARNHRTQEANRREALARLQDLIARALKVPKPRRATRPTRAANERRLAGKAQRQRHKRLRGAVRHDD
jgi:ribosome-associated protein